MTLTLLSDPDKKEILPQLNFDDTLDSWNQKNHEVREFRDDAGRTFSTIISSESHCTFFDVHWAPVTAEYFKKKYDMYSGTRFLTVMNKTTGEFIIRPLARWIVESTHKVVKKVKKLIWKAKAA